MWEWSVADHRVRLSVSDGVRVWTAVGSSVSALILNGATSDGVTSGVTSSVGGRVMDVTLVALKVAVGSRVAWSFETDFVNVTDAVTTPEGVVDGDDTCDSLSVTDCVSIKVSSLVLLSDIVLDGSTDNDRVGFGV